MTKRPATHGVWSQSQLVFLSLALGLVSTGDGKKACSRARSRVSKSSFGWKRREI